MLCIIKDEIVLPKCLGLLSNWGKQYFQLFGDILKCNIILFLVQCQGRDFSIFIEPFVFIDEESPPWLLFLSTKSSLSTVNCCILHANDVYYLCELLGARFFKIDVDQFACSLYVPFSPVS